MLAQHLDSLGAVVFAGCLHADGPTATKLKNEGSQRLHIMQMDVTDEVQVTKCAEFVNKTLKGSGKSSSQNALWFLCLLMSGSQNALWFLFLLMSSPQNALWFLCLLVLLVCYANL